MSTPNAISAEWLLAYSRLLADRVAHGSYVGYRLCLRDIKTTYSKMAFGVVWDFVEPIVMAIIFIFLHRSQAIGVSAMPIPYGLYVVIGIMLWQTFAESLIFSMDSISRMQGLLGNLRVPPESVILALGLRELFNSFFRWAVIVVTLIWFGYGEPLNALLLFLGVAPIILLGFSIGFLVAPFCVVSGDVSTAIHIILRPLMFMSAALFPLPTAGYAAWLSILNPVAVMIENIRTLGTSGHFASFHLFLATLIAAGCMFLLAWYVYRVCIRLVVWQT